jgi:hypothetical protein
MPDGILSCIGCMPDSPCGLWFNVCNTANNLYYNQLTVTKRIKNNGQSKNLEICTIHVAFNSIHYYILEMLLVTKDSDNYLPQQKAIVVRARPCGEGINK